MAKFKTHISWGILIATVFLLLGFFYSIISDFQLAGWIFGAILIGSFLPDLDLDDGIPFQIFFGLLAIIFSGLFFLSFYSLQKEDWQFLAFVSVLIFAIIRFGLGYVFKKFTHHRGMFHSIPAVLLSGLAVIWMLHFFSILKGFELWLGLAVALGYLGHLILDEVHSSVNLSGGSFLPKKSLGSALKFFAQSSVSTTIFYLLLVFLLLTLPETRDWAREFLEK